MERSASDEVMERLTALRKGGGAGFISLRALPIGWGGQLNHRLVTLALALALDRTPVFPRLDDPPYAQVFEAMGFAVDLSGTETEVIRSLALPDGQPANLVYDPLMLNVYEAWDELLRLINDRQSVAIGSAAELQGCLLTWMTPIPSMAEFADDAARSLEVDNATIGVHFRRGDKAVETPYVPSWKINDEIARIHARWSFAKLFLASDLPTADAHVAPPADVRLIFDRTEQRFNNANHVMARRDPAVAQRETMVAFKNFHLLSQCGGIVGQSNAHFAQLAKAVIIYRTGNDDRTCLVDGNFAGESSHMIRGHFALKRLARRLARHLMPNRTIVAARKRFIH